jgi:hypothetical protein
MANTICNGDVFGRLKVVSEPFSVNGKKYFSVRCTCGVEKSARADHLVSGGTKSCGCHRSESSTRRKTHGMTNSSEYEIWSSMKKRCYNKNNVAYKNYGGRGIFVCNEWLVFENFYRDMGPRPVGASIDRIDNNKGYSKENCTWSTDLEQANNRRNVKRYVVGELNGTLPQLCRALNMPRHTVWARLKVGCDVVDAFTRPINRKKGRRHVQNA